MSWSLDQCTYLLATAGLDLSSNTIKACLLGVSSSALSQTNQPTLISSYATLGRYGGSSDQTLGSKTVTKDTTLHRTEFDCADFAWASLAFNTENVGGILIYRDTGGGDGPPVAVINDAAIFPLVPTGVTLTVTVHADGLAQLTS